MSSPRSGERHLHIVRPNEVVTDNLEQLPTDITTSPRYSRFLHLLGIKRIPDVDELAARRNLRAADLNLATLSAMPPPSADQIPDAAYPPPPGVIGVETESDYEQGPYLVALISEDPDDSALS